MLWLYGRATHGPKYFATLEEAEKHRDASIETNRLIFKPTPADFWYPDRAVETHFCPWLEQYVDGAWQRIAGSERECLAGIKPDAEAEAIIRRDNKRRR